MAFAAGASIQAAAKAEEEKQAAAQRAAQQREEEQARLAAWEEEDAREVADAEMEAGAYLDSVRRGLGTFFNNRDTSAQAARGTGQSRRASPGSEMGPPASLETLAGTIRGFLEQQQKPAGSPSRAASPQRKKGPGGGKK